MKDLYEFEPGGPQDWAEQMAVLLIEASDAARDARAAGRKALDPDTGKQRGLTAAGPAV